MSATTFDPDRRLAEVLATHFDPAGGTVYWLERAEALGFDPREKIKSIRHLSKMGLMDAVAMRRQPITDFVPRRLRDRPQELILAQTGGTLGRPLWTAYTPREFEEAFVTPFVTAARHVGFPRGGNWLYVGPSGPHIISRAADSLARSSGCAVPFTVDFDARWAKKLPAGSFAARRYLEHVVAQALDVIENQSVEVIFTTPMVLAAIGARMSAQKRKKIRGVHYGGMTLSRSDLARFQCELFTNAVHFSGFGNTLFGCCLELCVDAGRELKYFPHGDRLLLGVLDEEGSLPQYDAVQRDGRLVFSRLDHCSLIVNFVERDRVRLVSPPAHAPSGFCLTGVASPKPCAPKEHGTSESLY